MREERLPKEVLEGIPVERKKIKATNHINTGDFKMLSQASNVSDHHSSLFCDCCKNFSFCERFGMWFGKLFLWKATLRSSFMSLCSNIL